MKLKYQYPKSAGGVQILGFDLKAKTMVKSSSYSYLKREVNLAVIDMREIPRANSKKGGFPIDPFLQVLHKKMEPEITESNVWLFILGDREDVKAANNFAAKKMDVYERVLSKYVPSRAELLDNVSNRGTAPDVPLLFLSKRGNKFAEAARELMKARYVMPVTNVYYWEWGRNTEAKWRSASNELRMEFYLEILQTFSRPDENVVGIYTGMKFMLAAKVRPFKVFTLYPRVEDILGSMVSSTQGCAIRGSILQSFWFQLSLPFVAIQYYHRVNDGSSSFPM